MPCGCLRVSGKWRERRTYFISLEILSGVQSEEAQQAVRRLLAPAEWQGGLKPLRDGDGLRRDALKIQERNLAEDAAGRRKKK